MNEQEKKRQRIYDLISLSTVYKAKKKIYRAF